MDDQPGAHARGPKQVGRSHGVVHHIEQAALGTQRAYAFEVGDLRAGIGDGFDEHHACVRAQRGGHLGSIAHIDHAHLHAQIGERAEHAVGVAKHELARHEVVARLEQREKHRADRRHARGKAHAALPLLHLREHGFERRRSWRALARVVETTRRRALEHGDQVFHALEAILHRGVQRLVDRPMLGAAPAVGVHDAGGEMGRGGLGGGRNGMTHESFVRRL